MAQSGGSATYDEVSSADIAATIARSSDLIVANNVTNLADSLDAQVEFSTSEGSYLSKPQLVPTASVSRDDIIEYTVSAGETIDDIAAKFNVTTDTIKWANGLSSNTVNAGTVLTIPPISGVLYTVATGDTPESLAQAYNSNAEQIIAFNDAEVTGLVIGSKIVIPNGVKPAPTQRRSASTASFGGTTFTGFSFGSEPLYGGNGYSFGYCTWHAANRRAAIGRPIPRNLGNAVTWRSNALASGYAVDGNPQSGDVLWHRNTSIARGLGHVAFVERVNPDGSILVSDMNYPVWNAITFRTIQPNEFGNYMFIH